MTGKSLLDIKSNIEVWKGQYITSTKTQTEWVKGPALLIEVTKSQYVASLDNDTLQASRYSNDTLMWNSEDGNNTNGDIRFLIDTDDSGQTKKKISGFLWNKGSTKPGSPNFSGKLDEVYLKPWSGSYMTIQINSELKWESGPEVVIEGGSNVETSHVLMGGKEMKLNQYSSPTINWSGEDDTQYDVTFYVDPQSNTNHFSGYMWKDSKPTKSNFVGSLDITGLAPWSAYYTTDYRRRW